jgi:hypothetical protein
MTHGLALIEEIALVSTKINVRKRPEYWSRPSCSSRAAAWRSGVAFTFLGHETHGKADPQDAEASAPVAVPVATTPGA